MKINWTKNQNIENANVYSNEFKIENKTQNIYIFATDSGNFWRKDFGIGMDGVI